MNTAVEPQPYFKGDKLMNTTHVGVSGILYENGKILLGQRSKDDAAYPGLWNTPGGGLNFREKIDDGIVREFLEETGLSVRPSITDKFQFVGDGLYLPEKHTILIFRRVDWNGVGRARALDGLDVVAWFSWYDIRYAASENLLTPLTNSALNAFYAYDRYHHY